MSNKPLNFKIIEVKKLIINETEEFFKKRGIEGFEAKVYWIGKRTSDETAVVSRVFIPKQIARKSIYGVSVEVPEEGNLELIGSLNNGEIALIKLHTHPKSAYLSKTDIENPFFRHEGAISIIVPEFCSKPLSNLAECSVNIFRNNRWDTLNSKQISTLFQVKE